MADRPLLLDTGFIVALVNRSDPDHARSVGAWANVRTRPRASRAARRRERRRATAANEFWTVARVVFSSASTCTVTPIDTYRASSAACTTF